MASKAKQRQRRWIGLNAALAVVILVPALIGFATKFREFVILLDTDAEGAFTLMPVLNYLTVCLGFLCLFGAAILHGMFRNVEQPKIDFLEREAALDAADPTALARQAAQPWSPSNRIREHWDREVRHG